MAKRQFGSSLHWNGDSTTVSNAHLENRTNKKFAQADMHSTKIKEI